MRRVLSLSFVFVTLVLLTACGSAAQVAAPENLIPAGANLIAQIQVSQLLQDPDFATLYDQAPKSSGDPQSFQELLDMAQEETGIDFRQFNSAILFGDISRDDEYFGVIAQGQVYWLVSSVTLLYTEVCNTESLALSIGAGLRPAPTPTNSGSERYTGLCTGGCYRERYVASTAG
jgi:hypothetical protein